MSYPQRYAVDLTTNGSGAATGYTATVNGELVQIEYVKTDFADGVSFTVTSERTGQTLWAESNVNASAVRAPGQQIHTTSGAAVIGATGGPSVAYLPLVNDRVKIVVASGGDTKTGTVYVTVI